MTTTEKKPFYLINSIDAKADDFTKEGYKVISFGQVKAEIMNVLKDKETAIKYHNWNEVSTPDNLQMKEIKNQLENIVFKESRGGGGRTAISWEDGESYLRYHSGIVYKWYNTQKAN